MQYHRADLYQDHERKLPQTNVPKDRHSHTNTRSIKTRTENPQGKIGKNKNKQKKPHLSIHNKESIKGTSHI